jgi:hypothetical protein
MEPHTGGTHDRAEVPLATRQTDPILDDRVVYAGAGDMLGGLSTRAGDTLGVDPDDGRDRFDPGPISGHQHDLDDVEPRTDSATTVHSIADIPGDSA